MDGTVVVTGASGFIGQALCEELLEQNFRVVGTSRSGSPPEIGIDWRQADITDQEDVVEALEGADYVFHLAGIGLMDGSPKQVREVNIEGTKNVVTAAEEHGCDRLVFTSTAGTRHATGRQPATEADVADPIGAYQESKLEAENVIQEFVDSGGNAVITHPTSVFGPGDLRTVPKLVGLVDSILPIYLPGGGSIVSVDDVASGLIAAADRGEAGKHYILGGENLTFGQMLQSIADEMEKSPPPIRVPSFAIPLAGYGIGIVNRLLGTAFFPVNSDMAKLSTRYRFYDSKKASQELDYDYRAFDDHVSEAIRWYRTSYIGDDTE